MEKKMENKNERVFAYNLAKVIDNSDLDNVSGGSAQMTTKQTVQPTGGSGQDIDGCVDVTFDW
ncbi:hypothetical protein [Legionella cardiaca]|uniref:Uncharacterized protein n=1 Tax=Legionella cardiaca TaxID=1071983 RepID=A0ABY8AU99_9GAMM|nr:hypothetical protein [Legionella cardiaca]WED42951.1 hypothetical protein PXX05_13765 [Legionella cardiaca]